MNPTAPPEQEAPPQVQMRPGIPPEEITHKAIADVQMGVSDDGQVVALTFVIPAPNKQYTFLIPADAAKQIGERLAAPHVERPPGLVVPGGLPS